MLLMRANCGSLLSRKPSYRSATRHAWRIIACGILSLALSGFGVATAADDDETPDAELLEFLGSWDDGQGNWIDPLTLGKDSAEEVTNDEQKQK